MQPSLPIAEKALGATWSSLSSCDRGDGPGSSGFGASNMRGSLLSATCRVKLHDLALSAQQSMAGPSPVVAPSLHLASGAHSVSGCGSGPDGTCDPGETSSASGSSSGSSDSVVIVCSGATCVPVSSAEPGLVVTDKAAAAEHLQADLPEASDSNLATSGVAFACPEDRSQLESALLLPTRSAADMRSSVLDESVDLVIASQECRPPSPAGDRLAVVRLNGRSSPLVPSSSFRFRCPTAPAHVSSPTSAVGESSCASAATAPLERLVVPQGIVVPRMWTLDQTPGADLPRPPTRRSHGPPRAFAGHRRGMSSTLLEREQQSIRAAGFIWRGRQQS